MLYILISGLVLLAIAYFALRSKGMTFSDAEVSVVDKLKQEEQTALSVFKAGKEDVLNEYERLKARVESLGSLTSKLPAAKIQSVAESLVVQQPIAAVEVVAPIVEAAPVINPEQPA